MSAADQTIFPTAGDEHRHALLSDADTLRGYLQSRPRRLLTYAEIDEVVSAAFSHLGILGVPFRMATGMMCLETGDFQFGNQVAASQRNIGGIGATNDGKPGVSNPSWAAAVAVYVAHLCAWCNLDGRSLVGVESPRRAIVDRVAATKGYARTFRDLGGRWAVADGIPWQEQATMPGNYGEKIENRARAIYGSPDNPPWPGNDGGATVPEIIDIRGKLPTKAGGGSGMRRGATLGQVLHYSAVNYNASTPILDILRSEANYHIDTARRNALKEAGLAYHYTVDPRVGTIYLCRDEDALLWHCGWWGPGGNGTGLAIHVPGGSLLNMAPVAVQSLLWLLRRNEAKYGFGRAALRGHLEVSATDCPGPLMDQIVYPYRAGAISWEGETAVSKAPRVDPVTGHTVHPELNDTYSFERHGRPLLPAVLYSDGVIRQLFERAVLAVGKDDAVDTIETLGHAFLFATGSGENKTVYPEWPGIHPLV